MCVLKPSSKIQVHSLFIAWVQIISLIHRLIITKDGCSVGLPFSPTLDIIVLANRVWGRKLACLDTEFHTS